MLCVSDRLFCEITQERRTASYRDLGAITAVRDGRGGGSEWIGQGGRQRSQMYKAEKCSQDSQRGKQILGPKP